MDDVGKTVFVQAGIDVCDGDGYVKVAVNSKQLVILDEISQ